MTIEVIKFTETATDRIYYMVKVDGVYMSPSHNREDDAMAVAKKIKAAGAPEIKETIYSETI